MPALSSHSRLLLDLSRYLLPFIKGDGPHKFYYILWSDSEYCSAHSWIIDALRPAYKNRTYHFLFHTFLLMRPYINYYYTSFRHRKFPVNSPTAGRHRIVRLTYHRLETFSLPFVAPRTAFSSRIVRTVVRRPFGTTEIRIFRPDVDRRKLNPLLKDSVRF